MSMKAVQATRTKPKKLATAEQERDWRLLREDDGGPEAVGTLHQNRERDDAFAEIAISKITAASKLELREQTKLSAQDDLRLRDEVSDVCLDSLPVPAVQYRRGSGHCVGKARSAERSSRMSAIKTAAGFGGNVVDAAPMLYGMVNLDGPNRTAKKMTVGNLIRELQAHPTDALALISSDEEGNQYKHLYNVIDGKFGEDEDDADDDRFEGHGLKVGDPYVIIWPHG
jgi:hypothetical protein